MYLVWDIGSGSTSQSATLNAWQTGVAYAATGAVHVTATNSATLGITGVKLEAGNVATPYPMEDLARKLARCQRYYQFQYATAVGYAGGAGAECYSPYYFPPMRTAPTVTFGTPSYSNASSLSLNNATGSWLMYQVTSVAAGQALGQAPVNLSAEI